MTDWEQYKQETCQPVESELFGFPVKNKERLISAILSNALLNERYEYPELKKIGVDESLETIGDTILDFTIIDHFAKINRYTPEQINTFREKYGNNMSLQKFSKKILHLQDYILWGPDEKAGERWDQPSTTLLADRFEMLIGVLYLEGGIDTVQKFLEKWHFYEEIDALNQHR